MLSRTVAWAMLTLCCASPALASSYNGNGNTGFGGAVGGAVVEITNAGDSVTITFSRGTGDLNDSLVLYIDAVTGGFTDTSSFADAQDLGRAALSGFDGSNRADVALPFAADFGISFDAANGGFLFALASGGAGALTYLATVAAAGLPTDATFVMTLSLAQLGLAPGDSFDFVATYLNATNAFRSDEAIGAGIAAGNPGVPSSVTFTSALTFAASGCGDGVLDAGEACDDGNRVDGDGCSATCTSETTTPVCGNGLLEGGEACDDGNTSAGDGCSATCSIESASPVCGNGVREGSEACDDGNTSDGDGCSASCSLETATPACGDGVVNGGEACDDGNTSDGDGCSATCSIEQTTDPETASPNNDSGGCSATAASPWWWLMLVGLLRRRRPS